MKFGGRSKHIMEADKVASIRELCDSLRNFRLGETMAEQAPKADSRSSPDINIANNNITKEITYIEKKPHTDVATPSLTLFDPILREITEFG